MNKKTDSFKNIITVLLTMLLLGIAAGPASAAADIVIDNARITSSKTVLVTFGAHEGNLNLVDQNKWHIDVGDGGLTPLNSTNADIISYTSPYIITFTFPGTPFSDTSKSYNASEGLYVDNNGVATTFSTNTIVTHDVSKAIADGQAPTVALNYSANPAKAGSMTITATYSEAIVGTPKISINQSGTTNITIQDMANSGDQTVWTYSYTVNTATGGTYIDGTATVSLSTVVDAAGYNAGSPTGTTFTIDTTAPAVALSYSANPAKAGAMTVTATYSEVIIGTPAISINQPGTTDITTQDMTDSGDQTVWTYLYTVNTTNGGAYVDGAATVSLSDVTDNATNNADSPTGTTFTIDTTAPTVALSYSANPAKAGSMTITATYSEAIVGTPKISINQSGTTNITTQDMANSGDQTVWTYSYTVNTANGGAYVDGAATVSLSDVTDNATNNADSPTGATFTIDTTAPTVAITAPTAGTTVKGTAIVSFTDTDLTSAQCSIDNTAWIACTSGITTLSEITGFNDLGEVAFTLYLKDTDAAGNVGTDTAGILKDTTAPSVALSYSANPAKAGAMTITATYSEAIVGTPAISINQPGTTDITTQDMTDSGDQTVWTYLYTVNTTNGGTYIDGTAIVSLSTVADAALNNASSPTGTTFTIDTTAPTVALSYSANPAKAGAMTVTATYSEVIVGTPTISIDQPGSTDITTLAMIGGATVWTYVYTVNTATGGAYIDGVSTVSLSTVADAATNNVISSTGTTFTIDTTAPTVAITAPTAGTTVKGTSTVSFTDTDLTSAQCSIDNTAWVACTSAVTTLSEITGFNDLGEVAFTLYLKDTDAAGNSGTDTAGILKDTTAPTVALSYSANPAKEGTMTITATYSEAIVGTPTISINQPGTTDITAQAMSGGATVWTYAYSVNTATDGTYIDGVSTVSLSTVADAAGYNAGTPSGTTFTIDTTAPSVALSYSANPAKAGSMTITATYSEVIVGTPTISINQPGTTDITAQAMIGGATVWTYAYTANTATGGTYIDGTSTVSLSNVADAATNNADAPTGTTFTIDTTAPTFTAARTALNAIVLTFSENVDVTTTAGQGYTLSSGTVSVNTDPAGSGNKITLTTSGVSGTPTVTYGAAAGTTVDTAANEVANGFSAVASSGSAASIVVTASNTSPMVNATVSINATVKDSSGLTSGSLGNGTISFLANGIGFASATLSDGMASTTYTRATAGAVTITAFYNATLQNVTTVTFTAAVLPALTVSASPANVTSGMPTSVSFTVTPALSGVLVTLSGAGVSVNGTTTNGTVTINGVNATSAGTITATASKSGYTSNTTTITAKEAETETPALASAITPNSRNAQLGTPVTLFMSVINGGTATATGVSIKQNSSLPATVSYQQWNGTSLIGSADTPMNMVEGATANFVLTINATSAFEISSMTFNVSSTNGATAPISAVNTLTISANATPSADVIIVSTTLNVSTPVNNATTFALATMNVGGTNATGVSLELSIPSTITGLAYQVNQTNSTTGAIIGPATGLTIEIGDTPTFAVFLTPTEAITYDPSNNRIMLQLVDGSGKVIGAQSVAVSTL
ncbi:MAG: hypothetical protein WC556_08455 [Candidatus Methanoperedens sp.]